MTFIAVLISALLSADEAGRATTLYANGDFEDALRVAQGAIEVAKSAQDRGKLHLLEARCLNALRRAKDVDRSLEAALTDAPELTLDEADSPTLVAAVHQARTRLAGTLEVDSEPKGAGVRIDGVLVGKAPISELVRVGRHLIEIIDRDGTEVSRREVTMPARGRVTLVLTGTVKEGPLVRAPTPLEPPPLQSVPPSQVSLTGTVRAIVDVCPGCGLGLGVEAGVGVLSRWLLAELTVIGGGSTGLGIRAGGRLAFAPRWSAQLTADGVLFFGQQLGPGVGGTVTGAFAVLSWLEVTVEFGVRAVFGAATHRSVYLLPMGGARLRFPPAPID